MMNIFTGIKIIDGALWIEKEKTLIISDTHIGYEGELHFKGIFVPKQQIQEIINSLKIILDKIQLKKKLKRIIINGDLKHEFGRISNVEWKEVLQLLDFLLIKKIEIVIIQGNHDPIIKPIAEKRNVKVVKEYLIGDTLILHGDSIPEILKDKKIKKIIIGHEHPAITIRENSKFEKYKCFLKGKWQKKELIVMPSFNPLLEGTDILKERLLSPFLENLSKFEVYIISKGEVFKFGKVKDLPKLFL